MLDGIDRNQPFALVFRGVNQVGSRFCLLTAERYEFEAVLGTTVVFEDMADEGSQRWIVRAPVEHNDPPRLEWDSESRTLTSFAATAEDFYATLNALHTLAWSESRAVTVTPAPTIEAAAGRIRDEVAATFPSLEVRQLDWARLTQRHYRRAASAADAFPRCAAEWVAELADAHTSVRRAIRTFNPPYRGTLTHHGVALASVPTDSPAGEAGVRAGWIVHVDDPQTVWRSTAAAPRHRSQVAARRALAVVGDYRVFTARDPRTGRRADWTETARPATLAENLHVSRDGAGDLFIGLRSFDGALDLAGAFDELLRDGTRSDHLTLDLRGNCGGSLQTATEVRDRFLRAPTTLGSIRFTTGTGQLAAAQPLRADPSERRRWAGHLTVLVDEMTYSAAEDFLLGLHGLDHVTALGRPTGGGSGRPRTIPLIDDLVLTVSTALTYDRAGRCIEYNGIPVDGPIGTTLA